MPPVPRARISLLLVPPKASCLDALTVRSVSDFNGNYHGLFILHIECEMALCQQSRWGEGLTAEDMKKCVWVRPEVVAQIEFLEWTGDHLRHSKFAGLRDDDDPRSVVKEHAGEA